MKNILEQKTVIEVYLKKENYLIDFLLQNLNITKKKLKMNVNKILYAGGRNLAM
jgi:hypothetical protein